MTGAPGPARGSFEQKWRRRFERFAVEAAAEYEVSGWSEAGLRRRLDAFEQLFARLDPGAGLRVLDLGTGPGTYVRLLRRLGHRAVGVDYSLPSLRRATLADGEPSRIYAAGDAYALPFADGTFDLVVMIGILQALSEPGAALREAGRALRPGGHVILEILNAEDLVHRAAGLLRRRSVRSDGVRRYRRADLLRSLSECGLAPVSVVPIYLPPRKYPFLERMLDHRACRWMLRAVPGGERAAAAAFLVLARQRGRRSEGAEGGSVSGGPSA